MSDMTVRVLIETLKKYPPDMPVRLWVDHGQCAMGVYSVEKSWTHKDGLDDYSLEDYCDEEDKEEYGFDTPFALIYSG